MGLTVRGSMGEKLEISFVYNVPTEPTVRTWRPLIPLGSTTGATSTVTIDPMGVLVQSH